MDRKTFIRTCGALSVAGLPVVSVLQGCAPTSATVTGKVEGDLVTVPLSEFTEQGGGGARPFILVRVDGMNKPICVYKKGPADYTALSTICTHRGCEVRPNEKYLACPCHGSEYSTSGEVLKGPAEIALKTYRTNVENENLRIHL